MELGLVDDLHQRIDALAMATAEEEAKRRGEEQSKVPQEQSKVPRWRGGNNNSVDV